MARWTGLMLLVLGGCTGGNATGGKDSATATQDSETNDSDSGTDSGTTDTGTTDPGENVANPAQSVDDGVIGWPVTLNVVGEANYASENLEGSLTYNTTFDGGTVCDATITLAGTPYTGTCDGCDFAFNVEGTVTADNSTGDCTLNPMLSFVPDATHYDLIMAHAETFAGYYGDLTNAFIAGYSYSPDYPGPYFYQYTSYDGSYYGTFTQEGTQFNWTYSTEGTSFDLSAYYQYCEYIYPYYLYEPVAGQGGTGELNCDGTVTDVWTFTAEKGGLVSVSVDTIAADSAFDAGMIVTDPDGCEVSFADDAFDCTFPPADYQCPAASFEAASSGTYTVVVESFGSCVGEKAEYSVQIQSLAK